MRQQIDCAVLSIATHETWMSTTLAVSGPALSRIKLHPLDWEDATVFAVGSDHGVKLDVQALAQAAVTLRRYDVCLIPVSLETLGWTRQALAAIPRGPYTPFVGVFNELRSAAMQDLLELGMADFVRLPVCPEELRARLLTTVSRSPKPGSLREPQPLYGSPSWCEQAKMTIAEKGKTHRQALEKSITRTLRPTRIAVGTNRVQIRNGISLVQTGLDKDDDIVFDSFRTSKSKVIEAFERDYISKALSTHQGNIASAARASNKHRRAFWALMRKYQIDAAQYRLDDDAE